MSTPAVDVDALKAEIGAAIVTLRGNACPIVLRLAWHASGTFDPLATRPGGSDGARMRFAPERDDGANAGLSLARDLLKPVKAAHPEVSTADLWAVAGAAAIEFMGGPRIPVRLGRTDDNDGAACPAHGRLPDAALDASHLRAVFHRMGFNDRDVVALSGAHTVGRCHPSRSGFDGPWTATPLTFDNSYFKALLELTWRPRRWDGPLQYEAATSDGDVLMMLPTDLALLDDPAFREWVVAYAGDERLFFADFARAFSKLLALGCPPQCQPDFKPAAACPRRKATATFVGHAQHGSLEGMRRVADEADVHFVDPATGRSALHKAALSGHTDAVQYLVNTLRLDVNARDAYGSTPLHDAARFNQVGVAKVLVAAGADLNATDREGHTASTLAASQGHHDIVAACGGGAPRSRL